MYYFDNEYLKNLIARGSDLEIYVDGIPYTISDSESLDNPAVGLAMDNNGKEVEFDYREVYQISIDSIIYPIEKLNADLGVPEFQEDGENSEDGEAGGGDDSNFDSGGDFGGGSSGGFDDSGADFGDDEFEGEGEEFGSEEGGEDLSSGDTGEESDAGIEDTENSEEEPEPGEKDQENASYNPRKPRISERKIRSVIREIIRNEISKRK